MAVDELSQICEGLARQCPENMPSLLNALALIAPLLNAIPHVVFFIKDAQARYLLANLTLARRCGFKSVSSLLGKTSAVVFPSAL
ncbi:AraC family transcriptional regulator, partial [Klebsiella pneumoniae]|nr:AraC family transcriptional regulator [Klebsiella pneumoniae]